MGGSKETQTQQSTATNAIDPNELKMLQDNYAAAQGRATSLTPYTGQITAGFSPTQTQAQGVLAGIASDPRYGAINQSAINSTQGLLSANPNTTVNAQPYTPGQLSNTDLTPYLNPYQKQVTDASIAQNQFARDRQGVADNSAATAAGAFGGTRQAVQRAETTAGYDRNDQQNLAALNSANFSQAQAAAGADIGARNTAAQFNSTQGVNAQQDSITNALAQAGYKLDAAGRLVSLNNSALGTATQQGGILASVGDAQQAQAQTELTNAYNAYMAGQQLTFQQQQMLNSALGLIPNQQTVTSSGTGTTTKSGDILGGILGAVAGGAKIGSSLYGG